MVRGRQKKMIRRAKRDDIWQLTEIYNDAILHTTATFDTELKGVEDRTRWYEAHIGKHVLLVCEEDGNVVGYASLSRYREKDAYDGAVELSVYVHSDYRGRGIGRALMEEILSWAEKCREIVTVISLITSENAVSIHLHEAFGFSFCGQIRCAGEKFGRSLHVNAYQIIYERGLKP